MTIRVELGEVGHQPLQLVDDVLHVLVVQQLQLDQHVGAASCEPLPRLSSTPQHQPGPGVKGH